MRKVLLPFCLLLAFSLIPIAVQAQTPSDTCDSICQPYSSCSQTCQACEYFDPYENYCHVWGSTSCGDYTGGNCGGCSIVDTWEVDEEVSHTVQPGLFCGHSYTWYGVDNPSLFKYVSKLMRHVTYGHQICGGQSSTVVVSSYYFNDHC